MSTETGDRRRALVRMLALASLGGSAAMRDVLAQGLFGDRPSRLPPGRSIYRLSGKVTVNGADATLTTIIKAGDTVSTAKGAEIVFVIGGQALILRADSTMTLGPAPDEAPLAVRALRVLSGGLLSVSSKMRLAVHTPTANVGVRGTGFYLEADPAQTYFCTCYGVTEIAAIGDPDSSEVVTAAHHDRPVYILKAGERGRKIRNAPFINHTDEELTLIEALVGRAPPFVFPKDSYSAPRRDY